MTKKIMKPNRFKFRAWDKSRKEMIFDYHFKILGNSSVWTKDHFLEDVLRIPSDGKFLGKNPKEVTLVLMQSTGLLDEKGKEIFEGDVLHLQKDPLTKPPHVWDNIKKEVTYKNGTFEVAGRSVFQASTLFKYKFEIIGNKFSNPELLNAKN